MAIGAVLAAMTLVVLDAGIANVALPAIGRSLFASPAAAVLVMTAYQTGLVMALLPVATVGERYGYRQVFIAGVALFTGASVLCSLAPTLPCLLVARFLQGLGGSAVMALGVALLRIAMPPGQLGRAIGWNALTVALSAAAGPTMGALILSVAAWPWLFAINLPVGLAALAASRALPHGGRSLQRMDMVSMALSAGAFGALVVSAELAPAIPALGVAGAATAGISLFALVRRENTKIAPQIPLDLLRLRSFRLSAIASTICFTGQTAGLVALPFHLQNGLHLSTLATGLLVSAWPLSVALTATISGRLADRWPAAWLCAVGGVLLAIGLAAISLSQNPNALWPIAAFASVCGVGFGLFNVPNNRTMFLSAPPERSAAAGGLQGTARLTGQTAGALLMSALFAATALEFAPRAGLLAGAILTLTAAVVSMMRS